MVSILELIVEQTRIYYVQQGDFLNFSLEDLFAFIGLNISISIVKLPRVHDYWLTRPMFRMLWFSAVMT